MEALWAPWRIAYIEQAKPEGCILCDKPGENADEANLILYRGAYNYVMLNAFPYNPGHLMVAPYRHINGISLLTQTESSEHFSLVSLCTQWLAEVMKPQGFNVGMNLGKVAGAGIEDHIHSHVVPRWSGDTNFMPVLGETKVMPEALANTWRRLKQQIS